MKSILLLRFVSDRLRDEAKSYIQLDFPQCEMLESCTKIFFDLLVTADDKEILNQLSNSIVRLYPFDVEVIE